MLWTPKKRMEITINRNLLKIDHLQAIPVQHLCRTLSVEYLFIVCVSFNGQVKDKTNKLHWFYPYLLLGYCFFSFFP